MTGPCIDDAGHQYQFLRQEKRNIGALSAPRYEYTDSYFCTRCLDYQRVAVQRTHPAHTDLGVEDVEWRKA